MSHDIGKYRWEFSETLSYDIYDRHTGWLIATTIEQKFAELIVDALNKAHSRGDLD